MNRNISLLIIIFLQIQVLYSQEFNDEIQSLKNYNINEAHNIKISSFSDIEAYYLKFQMNHILEGRLDSSSMEELSLKSNKTYRDQTLKVIMQGDYYLLKTNRKII